MTHFSCVNVKPWSTRRPGRPRSGACCTRTGSNALRGRRAVEDDLDVDAGLLAGDERVDHVARREHVHRHVDRLRRGGDRGRRARCRSLPFGSTMICRWRASASARRIEGRGFAASSACRVVRAGAASSAVTRSAGVSCAGASAALQPRKPEREGEPTHEDRVPRCRCAGNPPDVARNVRCTWEARSRHAVHANDGHAPRTART